MTTSAELQGRLGSEEQLTGDTTGPARTGPGSGHVSADPPPAESKANGVSVGDALPGTNGHKSWTLADAARIYGIQQWGSGYFSINDQGHVAVHPTQEPSKSVDLKVLVDELRERDIALPILLRFTDILRHRVGRLHEAFSKAIRDHDYRGDYQCVYPIKVNQQRHVVEEIRDFGKEFNFGLEAGSKPELLAVLAMVEDEATPIICNGFKDDEFIEAVILAAKIGKNIIPVVEKFSELELIVKYAKLHNVKPSIGVRVKLSAKGAGRWEQSGGVRSKFGLFISEVIEALEYLRRHGMGDCLNLLHFHLGSQINNIRNIKQAIIELVRVYVEMQRLGAGLKVHRRGRRPRRRLRRQPHRLRLERELRFARIRQRRRLPREGNLRPVPSVDHPTIISESPAGRWSPTTAYWCSTCSAGAASPASTSQPVLTAQRARPEMPAPVVNLFDTFTGP